MHHDWLLVAVHAALEVTPKGVVPAGAETDLSDGETEIAGSPFNSKFVARLKQFVELVSIWLLVHGVPEYWKTLVA